MYAEEMFKLPVTLTSKRLRSSPSSGQNMWAHTVAALVHRSVPASLHFLRDLECVKLSLCTLCTACVCVCWNIVLLVSCRELGSERCIRAKDRKEVDKKATINISDETWQRIIDFLFFRLYDQCNMFVSCIFYMQTCLFCCQLMKDGPALTPGCSSTSDTSIF